MKITGRYSLILVACTSLLAYSSGAMAQQSADELAKQLSNPIASLTSVPLQLNWDDNVGPAEDGTKTTLNIQPVIPVSISEDWNMISRTILPIISQNDIFPGAGSQFGLGDTTQSLFFSPKAPSASGWIWGVGPVLLIPTGTDDLLGTGKWGAGPTAVVLKQTSSGWTYGALVNQIWSFAGDDDRADVNSTYFQPFLAKGLGKGRTLSFNFESTYDWETDKATVPLNIAYSKVTRWGKQLVSLQGGVRYYVEQPQSDSQWGLRFVVTLLYPK
ncbi:transporter [Dokdonella sp.]|uniref:transporter n=1 Tax=Dokdonella sp. TaxID=2291710 RepID=UPI003526DD9A